MSLYALLLGVVVMSIWGFNFIVIKIGVDHLEPLILVALRFTFAVIPVVFFVPRPKVPWRFLFFYGICFGAGVWGMVTWSIEAGISAGMAGLLLQMNVIISIVLGACVLKEQIGIQKILGVMISLSGIVLSLSLADGSVNLRGFLLVLVGAISWSLTSLITKAANTKQVFAFSIWGMLFVPLPLFALSWVVHGSQSFTPLWDGLDMAAWASIFFQAYPTTLFGYWVWNKLVVHYPLSMVAPLTFLVPVFGLLSSYLFLGEPLGWVKLVAAMLVIGGLSVSMLPLGKFFSQNKRSV